MVLVARHLLSSPDSCLHAVITFVIIIININMIKFISDPVGYKVRKICIVKMFDLILHQNLHIYHLVEFCHNPLSQKCIAFTLLKANNWRSYNLLDGTNPIVAPETLNFKLHPALQLSSCTLHCNAIYIVGYIALNIAPEAEANFTLQLSSWNPTSSPPPPNATYISLPVD